MSYEDTLTQLLTSLSPKLWEKTKAIPAITTLQLGAQFARLDSLIRILKTHDTYVRQSDLNPRIARKVLTDNLTGLTTLNGLLLQPLRVAVVSDDPIETFTFSSLENVSAYIISGRHRLLAVDAYSQIRDIPSEDILVPVNFTVCNADLLSLFIISGNTSRIQTATEKLIYKTSSQGFDTTDSNQLLEVGAAAKQADVLALSALGLYLKVAVNVPLPNHTFCTIARSFLLRILGKTRKVFLTEPLDFYQQIISFLVGNLDVAIEEAKVTNVARNASAIVAILCAKCETQFAEQLEIARQDKIIPKSAISKNKSKSVKSSIVATKLTINAPSKTEKSEVKSQQIAAQIAADKEALMVGDIAELSVYELRTLTGESFWYFKNGPGNHATKEQMVAQLESEITEAINVKGIPELLPE